MSSYVVLKYISLTHEMTQTGAINDTQNICEFTNHYLTPESTFKRGAMWQWETEVIIIPKWESK